MEKICKIVYFDEDSVTDYVQIVAGGELENTTELLKSRDAQEAQSVQANGKVGISGIFKALLGWEAGASADVSAGLSFNSSKMVKNIVKNTILTDFLKTIEDVSQGGTNPAFYNAFYELFDEGRYVDTNYDVNLGQAIFLLTCNFGSEEEIKKILGPAMFSRIGCCIAYEELSTEQKQTIVHNWYESILSVLKADEKEEIEKTDILDWFIKNAERYDNIRILKTKLENAIFDRLSEVFIIS